MRVPSKVQLLREVAWKDLVPISPREGLVECLHPLPWLIASLILAHLGLFLFALPCTFMFFLTALRLNHEAIHQNLGLAPKRYHFVFHGLSMVMLASNHSVAWNHLIHHRNLGGHDDLEGKAGRMAFLQVLAYGPKFAIETHREAWRHGGAKLRRKMQIDLSLNLLLVALALTLPTQALVYHIIMMVFSQCMTAFFAVWITHRGCDHAILAARTMRNRMLNFASYNMLLHLEHHLFPAVPVKRLGELAARIDKRFPELGENAGRVVPGTV